MFLRRNKKKYNEDTSYLKICNLCFQHTNDFALYTEAIKFFNHSETMVRIAVRTITLNVYKGRSLLQFICSLCGKGVCPSAETRFLRGVCGKVVCPPAIATDKRGYPHNIFLISQ